MYIDDLVFAQQIGLKVTPQCWFEESKCGIRLFWRQILYRNREILCGESMQIIVFILFLLEVGKYLEGNQERQNNEDIHGHHKDA